MSQTIAVFGSVNMDLVMRVQRVPGPGETLSGKDFSTIPGGKGANQAVAIARLGKSAGIRAAMIACVGGDSFGTELQTTLAADGISLDHLTVCDKVATGVALILVESNGQNRIVLAAGANDLLSPLSAEQAQETIKRSSLLVCQLETPLAGITQAIALAKTNNVPVILNPAPAQSLPADLLRHIDYLIPNESEATLLSGIQVTDIPSARAAASHLLAMGPRHVLVTLGAQGVLLATQHKDPELLPAFRVTPIDTTAAGDTFIGGLAVGLVEKMDIRDAILLGQRAAAISVTRTGAQTSIPSRLEVDTFSVQP